MDNCFEEMDRTSVTNNNDNDNVNVNHGNDENHDNNQDSDDDMMSDCNLAIGDLLPSVSLKRRSATPEQVLNDDETHARAATVDNIVAVVAATATTTATATVRSKRTPRSITPNLFLPILVPEGEDKEDDDRDDCGEECEDDERNSEEKEEGNEGSSRIKMTMTRKEGEDDVNDAEGSGETPTPQKQNDSHYPAVRLFPTTKTTVVIPALPSIPLPLPLLCTPQQHKPNEEATYDDIICHYNALIQKQRCTPQQRRRSTTPRTPNQQHYESLSYSSSSNEGTGDGKKNGMTVSTQPLLLSPYFLFTPDVVSSQDEYVIPHDPPALVITNTVPIMNVEDEDDSDTMERQLCAQLSRIPSLSKVLEEAEAVAVNPHYTDQNGGTTVGVGSSFSNNKTTMTTQPSSVRPLRMRRRETMTSGIFRTSITGLGGVGSNGTTAMPLLRKCSRLTTKTTTTRTINAPL